MENPMQDAMLTDDTKLMVDVIRMLAFPSGAAPPLVTAATAQLHRLTAQEALMVAIDQGELREVGVVYQPRIFVPNRSTFSSTVTHEHVQNERNWDTA